MATLKGQVKELTEQMTKLTTQIEGQKFNELDREVKANQLNLANQTTVISELKTELTLLRTKLDEFMQTSSTNLDELKRELISYIILSNASKDLDTAKLAESARHLASGIAPVTGAKDTLI